MNKALREELRNTKKKLAAKVEKVVELEAKLNARPEVSAVDVAKHNVEIKALEDELALKTRHLSELKMELKAMYIEMSKMRKKIEESETAINEVQSRHVHEQIDKKMETGVLELEVQQLTEAKKELEKQLHDMNNSLLKKNSIIKDLKDFKTKMKCRDNNSQKMIASLREDLRKSQEEHSKCTLDNSTGPRVAELEKELSERNMEFDILRNWNQSQEKEINTKDETINELRKQLQSPSMKQELSTENEKLKKEVEFMRLSFTKVTDTKNKISDLEKRIKGLETKNVELERELADKDDDIDRLRSTRSRLDKDVDKLTDDLERLNRKYEKLDEENEKLSGKLRRRDDKIESYRKRHASTSSRSKSGSLSPPRNSRRRRPSSPGRRVTPPRYEPYVSGRMHSERRLDNRQPVYYGDIKTDACQNCSKHFDPDGDSILCEDCGPWRHYHCVENNVSRSFHLC